MMLLIILCLWIFTFIDIHLYYTLPKEYRKKTRKYQRWHDLLGGGVVAHYLYFYHYKKYRIYFKDREKEDSLIRYLPLLYTKQNAFETCKEFNDTYVNIDHWVEPYTGK